jgi:uroporphyrinogen-III decarboxylase
MIASKFSTPEMRNMIETFWKIDDMLKKINEKKAALDAKFEELGYPVMMKGIAIVPFDSYSDNYRGTINGLADLYEHEDIVLDFTAKNFQQVLASISMQAKMFPGKFLFMPLHKGMDKFMSDAQYRKYYWKDLQAIIEHIIKVGMIPYIYTEGPYTSRLDCLKDVPPGKVLYHFEECDMAKAKKALGDVACIGGGFNANLLQFNSKQEVIDECKRLIDTCAGGGGYIFGPGSGINLAKEENLDAMFETVKTYGKK